MAEPHVVTALIAKRAEIDGEIERTEKQPRRLRDALEHIDETLRLFAPDAMPELIKPKSYGPRRLGGSWGADPPRPGHPALRPTARSCPRGRSRFRVVRDRGLDTSRSKLVLAVMGKA